MFHLMPTDRKPEFFKSSQLKVGIIGCGYVGLPLALRFAEAGHRVTGFDTDPEKIRMLNSGKSYIEHIQQNKIQQYVNSRHFGATNHFSRLSEADAIIICVPTPLNEYREPDLSYVEKTAKSIQPHLQKGQPVTIGVEPCPYVAVFVVRRVVLNEHPLPAVDSCEPVVPGTRSTWKR
jgi:nucleotide sugar dehydrogenase